MANQAFFGLMSHPTSQACIVDTTPPTFSGIASVAAQANGSILVSWLAATEIVSLPIHYKVYIQPSAESSATLFSPGNHIITVHHLQSYIFIDRDDNFLVKDQSYRFGVHAIDAIGNEDSNMVSLVETSQGVLIDDLLTLANLLIDRNQDFIDDHANFVSDHANFVADDAAFDADHANFVSDHANFVYDHANFVADHTNFLTDHANFVEDHANLSETAEDLDANIVRLTASDLAGTIIDEQEISATLTEEDEL